jgi:hypothetical protein
VRRIDSNFVFNCLDNNALFGISIGQAAREERMFECAIWFVCMRVQFVCAVYQRKLLRDLQ